VTHAGVGEHTEVLEGAFAKYRATLENDRQALFGRFEIVDFASKVVGVGSVGTRCFVALLMSDIGDPLFLQIKEAGRSLVAPHVTSRPARTGDAAGVRPTAV
jgi:uncharacterized protein (DUF2252 family)